jgi:transcriptional regulator with XRE-family HTH domain
MVRLLDRLIRDEGLRNCDAAQAAGVSPGRLSELRNGRSTPPRDSVTLKRLAKALGHPVDDAGALLDEIDEDTATAEAAPCGPGS